MGKRVGSFLSLKPGRGIAPAFAALMFLIVGGCGQSPSGPSQVIQLKGMTVTVTGEYKTGGSTIGIKFADAQGRPVEVGKVTFGLKMDMSGMPMMAGAEISGAAGNYIAKIKPEMGGAWMATLRYDGPQGSGQTVFPVNVK